MNSIFAKHKEADGRALTLDTWLDEEFGSIGTPERDAIEQEAQRDIDAYYADPANAEASKNWRPWENAPLGNLFEAIRDTRQAQNLSQDELGAKAGVPAREISDLEQGANTDLGVLSKVCRALGLKAFVDFGLKGKIALW